MTTINIMLDLETWGKRPGCDLRSIGACVFDPATDTISGWDHMQPVGHRLTSLEGLFYIATDNPVLWTAPNLDGVEIETRRYDLTRDPSTVQWWSDQSAEAQAAFTDPVELREALERFDTWLQEVTAVGRVNPAPMRKVQDWQGLRLWAHGPSFDVSILEAAYHAVGLPVPWHYRAPRDTRTILEAAGMDPHKGLEPFSTGTYHHALDDAIGQARAVCHAIKLLRPLPADVRAYIFALLGSRTVDEAMQVWQQNPDMRQLAHTAIRTTPVDV